MQEVDLAPGTTLLGRSPDCALTIEDPLVSRQHARIIIQGDRVAFEDLGSRNGSRVNGVPIRGTVPIKDGDRLRIGTQEFVFCSIASDRSGPLNRRTGFMTFCAICKVPYPEEMGVCPHCGSQDRTDEETTLSGTRAEDNATWALLLIVDVLERAVANGRLADAERIMRRAANTVTDMMAAEPSSVDEQQFRRLAEVAASYARLQQSSHWACWILGAFATMGLIPHTAVVSELQPIRLEGGEGRKAMDDIISRAKARRSTLSDEDLEALSILELWGLSPQHTTGS